MISADIFSKVCENRFNELVKTNGKENVKYISRNKAGEPGISTNRTWIYAKNKSGNYSAVLIEGPDCVDGCEQVYDKPTIQPTDEIAVPTRDPSCDNVTVIVPSIDKKKIINYSVKIYSTAFAKLLKKSWKVKKLRMCQYDDSGHVSKVDITTAQ